MNLAIFDLCNAILFVIVIVAAYNMAWHLRFYTQKRRNPEQVELDHKKVQESILPNFDFFAFSIFSYKLGHF
jgi:hypothetical protein